MATRGRPRTRDPDAASSSRSLRQKAEKFYRQQLDSDSDSDGGDGRLLPFSVHDKLHSAKFAPYFVKELNGGDVNLEYFQRSGFNVPLLVKEKTGLEMTVPDAASGFGVTDVRNAVGARRTVDVMDCSTQRNSEMAMKDFEE